VKYEEKPLQGERMGQSKQEREHTKRTTEQPEMCVPMLFRIPRSRNCVLFAPISFSNSSCLERPSLPSQSLRIQNHNHIHTHTHSHTHTHTHSKCFASLRCHKRRRRRRPQLERAENMQKRDTIISGQTRRRDTSSGKAKRKQRIMYKLFIYIYIIFVLAQCSLVGVVGVVGVAIFLLGRRRRRRRTTGRHSVSVFSGRPLPPRGKALLQSRLRECAYNYNYRARRNAHWHTGERKGVRERNSSNGRMKIEINNNAEKEPEPKAETERCARRTCFDFDFAAVLCCCCGGASFSNGKTDFLPD